MKAAQFSQFGGPEVLEIVATKSMTHEQTAMAVGRSMLSA